MIIVAAAAKLAVARVIVYRFIFIIIITTHTFHISIRCTTIIVSHRNIANNTTIGILFIWDRV